jgi:hypothetical protein
VPSKVNKRPPNANGNRLLELVSSNDMQICNFRVNQPARRKMWTWRRRLRTKFGYRVNDYIINDAKHKYDVSRVRAVEHGDDAWDHRLVRARFFPQWCNLQRNRAHAVAAANELAIDETVAMRQAIGMPDSDKGFANLAKLYAAEFAAQAEKPSQPRHPSG